MDAAVNAGITLLDTADMYSRWATHSYAGHSEEIIGRWLRQQQRDKLVIATKVRGPMSDDPVDQGLSRRHITAAVEASLRRLQTDYIDLYQTHWPDDEVALEETLRTFDDLQRDGKVRAIGCSNSPASYIIEALSLSEQLGLARFQTLQPHYNLVHRAEFEAELRAVCIDHSIGVIPYSPLAGGFLSGKYKRGQASPAGSRGADSDKIRQYIADERNFDLLDKLQAIGYAHGKTVAQTALAWLIDAPAVTAPIIGANSVAQLHDTLGAVEYTLAAEERQQLDTLSSRP
jgi:aryl-alcohol dehydrogenase-like predicted oxidoreductase